MDNGLFQNIYNPDVLSCIANLSNDEVFTPPELANKMLDMLPQELFENPDTTFLDPACKSGVFLREIAKRLIKGLEPQMPNLEKRLEHIYTKQLFGIAITELTSLLSRRSVYCSKYPSSRFSLHHFDEDQPQGNIIFQRIRHTWINGRCPWCGASQSEYDRGVEFESYAYQFIHTNTPLDLFNMKFDVIIGNPPYQLNVGVQKDNYAIPIYQKFVLQAKKLNPRFISMIIPAKWYTGGRGLDDFRTEMLNDGHIAKIVDFPNPYDCFQGVDNPGGICYFLWDRDKEGPCEFTTSIGNSKTTIVRNLNEFPIFVRDIMGLNIIKKVLSLKINGGKVLSDVVSPQTPFGIITSYQPKDSGVPCWFKQSIGLKYVSASDYKDLYGLINKHKLLIPEAPIAGQTDFTKPVGLYYKGNTVISQPGECCSQTYLVANAFDTAEETLHFQSFLLTKIVRFLVLQAVVSQHVSREKFCFVPDLGHYDVEYTDEMLRKEWGITNEEWEYIDSRIHNYSSQE